MQRKFKLEFRARDAGELMLLQSLDQYCGCNEAAAMGRRRQRGQALRS